jgi:hypothetical protein
MQPICPTDVLSALRDGTARIDWVDLPLTEHEIMDDALRIEGVIVPVSPRTAQRAADLLTAMDPDGHLVTLLTPELVDLAYQFARFRPPPMPLGPRHDPREWASAVEHSRRVNDWLLCRGWTPGDVTAPVGCDWVLTDDLTPSRAFTYGWHEAGHPRQPLEAQDGLDAYDYRQTLRLARIRPGWHVPGLGRFARQPGVTRDCLAPSNERISGAASIVEEVGRKHSG